MADEITVVRVERERLRANTYTHWRVYFSKPVHLRDIGKSDNWCAESGPRDELDAFQWGLEVIEKHKETKNGKRP